MSSAQLDMFEQTPAHAASVPRAWTAEERRQIDSALVGRYQEIAVAAGLHSMGRRGHLAHADACAYIADEPRAAIRSGLCAILGSAERSAAGHDEHAAWLETEQGRQAYGPDAGASAPRFRELAREQWTRATWFKTLIAKVEGAPLYELPIDLQGLRARARQARAGAELDLSDPELRVVTHWPAGMMSNGPMCEEPGCVMCARVR